MAHLGAPLLLDTCSARRESKYCGSLFNYALQGSDLIGDLISRGQAMANTVSPPSLVPVLPPTMPGPGHSVCSPTGQQNSSDGQVSELRHLLHLQPLSLTALRQCRSSRHKMLSRKGLCCVSGGYQHILWRLLHWQFCKHDATFPGLPICPLPGSHSHRHCTPRAVLPVEWFADCNSHCPKGEGEASRCSSLRRQNQSSLIYPWTKSVLATVRS